MVLFLPAVCTEFVAQVGTLEGGGFCGKINKQGIFYFYSLPTAKNIPSCPDIPDMQLGSYL